METEKYFRTKMFHVKHFCEDAPPRAVIVSARRQCYIYRQQHIPPLGFGCHCQSQSSLSGVKIYGSEWRNKKALAKCQGFFHGIIYILRFECFSKQTLADYPTPLWSMSRNTYPSGIMKPIPSKRFSLEAARASSYVTQEC